MKKIVLSIENLFVFFRFNFHTYFKFCNLKLALLVIICSTRGHLIYRINVYQFKWKEKLAKLYLDTWNCLFSLHHASRFSGLTFANKLSWTQIPSSEQNTLNQNCWFPITAYDGKKSTKKVKKIRFKIRRWTQSVVWISNEGIRFVSKLYLYSHIINSVEWILVVRW